MGCELLHLRFFALNSLSTEINVEFLKYLKTDCWRIGSIPQLGHDLKSEGPLSFLTNIKSLDQDIIVNKYVLEPFFHGHLRDLNNFHQVLNHAATDALLAPSNSQAN